MPTTGHHHRTPIVSSIALAVKEGGRRHDAVVHKVPPGLVMAAERCILGRQCLPGLEATGGVEDVSLFAGAMCVASSSPPSTTRARRAHPAVRYTTRHRDCSLPVIDQDPMKAISGTIWSRHVFRMLGDFWSRMWVVVVVVQWRLCKLSTKIRLFMQHG